MPEVLARGLLNAGDIDTHESERKYVFRCFVRADGIMLPIGGSGDFGSSPLFGQLTEQATGLLEFDYVACRTPKHNSRSRMTRRGHALICERIYFVMLAGP